MTTAKTANLSHDNASINYYQGGEGEFTLLFLHGWCINSEYWEEQFKYFSSNYQVIAMDLPGFGRSSANRKAWTIENYSQDVLAFIESLDLYNVILIGHSMSGDIILEMALSNNKRIVGLVGVDNFKLVGSEFTPEQAKQMKVYFESLEKDFKNTALNGADNMLFHTSTSEAVVKRVKNDIANAEPAIGYSSLSHLMQYAASEAEKLSRLNYQLHLISSDATPTNTIGLEETCKNGYKLVTVGATGHYPMVESPKKFNQSLEGLLDNILQQHQKNNNALTQ